MEQIKNITLYHGDCLDVMPTLADGGVDMILVDLPYEVLNKRNQHAQWDKEIDIDALWAQWKRVIKPNGAIVLFGQGLFSAKLMLSNPKMYRYSLVWDKCRVTGFLNVTRMPLRRHEDILVFYQSLPTYNPQMQDLNGREKNHSRQHCFSEVNRCYGNFKRVPTQILDKKFPQSIISIPKEHINGKYYHPTQKPVALLEYLIKTYTNEGDCVLDCACGSGSTLVACANTNRRGIGIEKNDEYYDIAVKRVKQAFLQPSLFDKPK